MGEAPARDDRPVAHVRFLNLIARLDAHELGEQTVHHIVIILALVSLGIRHKSQLNELWVSEIIQSEEVGAGLLNGAAVGFQRIGRDSRKELPTAMP